MIDDDLILDTKKKETKILKISINSSPGKFPESFSSLFGYRIVIVSSEGHVKGEKESEVGRKSLKDVHLIPARLLRHSTRKAKNKKKSSSAVVSRKTFLSRIPRQ